MELHNLEATLSNEREQHMNEMKALKAIVNDKVLCQIAFSGYILTSFYNQPSKKLQWTANHMLIDS